MLGMLAQRLTVPSSPPKPGQIFPVSALIEINRPSDVGANRRLMQEGSTGLIAVVSLRSTSGLGSPRLAWPVTTFCGTPAAFVVTSATLAARRCSPVDAACGAPVAGVAVEAAGGIAA